MSTIQQHCEAAIKARLTGKATKQPNGCLVWSGHKDADGYGRIVVLGKVYLVHRLAYEMANGPIPDGMLVCHSCDLPACINPLHLWLGTVADNNTDRETKGRGRAARGERQGHAKLTAKAVRDILSRGLTGAEYARKYGVSRSNITNIQQGKSWRHIRALPFTRKE